MKNVEKTSSTLQVPMYTSIRLLEVLEQHCAQQIQVLYGVNGLRRAALRLNH